MGTLRGDGRGRRTAAHAKQLVESHPDSLEIILRHAKGGAGESNLLYEVSHLIHVEVHELVYLVHGGLASVAGEAGHTVLRAAEQGAEELVKVSQKEAG